MALYVNKANPAALLAAIKKAIDDKKITTWSYDSDGDFTHTPDQWARKAWMRPRTINGVLAFGIIKPVNSTLTTLIYGLYHGRFTEMLLAHFDDQFHTVEATAQVVSGIDTV